MDCMTSGQLVSFQGLNVEVSVKMPLYGRGPEKSVSRTMRDDLTYLEWVHHLQRRHRRRPSGQ